MTNIPAAPANGSHPMNPRADDVRAAYPLFQGERGGSTPTSALQLRFRPIPLDTARQLNRTWHSRLPYIDRRVAGWVCYAAECDGVFYAAAVWGLPVARMLPQDGSCLELRRFAIAPDAPRNTASRMLAWMARTIVNEYPNAARLISYQDCDTHQGTIYRAAGWIPFDAPGVGCWNHAGRSRPARRILHKVRWEKSIRAAAPAVPPPVLRPARDEPMPLFMGGGGA
jgi:hypothetical protein